MSGRVASPAVRLTLLGAALTMLTVGGLAIHLPGADTIGTPLREKLFVGVAAAGVALYLAAVRVVLRGGLSRSAVWIILGLAALMRVALLPAPPFLSSDVYRYVWDGHVQAAGINPYLHVPADPALSSLRDPDVYPLINRKTYARTIYPPAAELVFAIVGRLTGTVTGMKVAMVGFEAAAMLCLLRILAIAGLPRERILIYAWNPLALWSFALDGHVDAIVVGLLALALLARAQHRDGLAGAVLGAAALAKFLPVVVAAAFVRGGRLWRPALAGAAVVALLYLPYLSAGRNLFSFLPAYGSEEGFDTGAGFWLAAGIGHLVPLPAWAGLAYTLALALGLAALSAWIAWGRPADPTPEPIALCRDAAILAAVATAGANPHYAWYYAWLAVPCVVAPIPVVIWLSSAPVLLFIDPFDDRFLWPSLVFVPALVLAARAVRRARPTFATAATANTTVGVL